MDAAAAAALRSCCRAAGNCTCLAVHRPREPAVLAPPASRDDLDLDESKDGLGGGSVRVATIMLYLSGTRAGQGRLCVQGRAAHHLSARRRG